MSIWTVGWPSEFNTARSAIPGTVLMTSLILAAVCSSVARSLPNSLTEFSPFTPDAASSTLSSMYCEKLNSTPGNWALSAALTCCVSFSLSTPRGQVSKGLRGTKNSALKKPVASVPSSGRPFCEMTVTASGKLLMIRRIRLT